MCLQKFRNTMEFLFDSLEDLIHQPTKPMDVSIEPEENPIVSVVQNIIIEGVIYSCILGLRKITGIKRKE